MMSNATAIISPLLVLVLGFVFSILFWKEVKVQTVIVLTALLAYLSCGVWLVYLEYNQGIQVVQIGDWPAPLGITLVVDAFSALMVLVSGIVALIIAVYSIGEMSQGRKKIGFYPVLLILMFGVAGSFLTGDIFNLYVWFEVMLLASFVLIVLGNSKAQLEGAVKYVILSFISSGFLLTGIGILYRLTGTLNMADLSIAISQHEHPALMTVAAVFFFMGFGIKAAVFPLFSWLPASYPTTPISVSALMTGLLTKVGVYAFIRFGTLLFTHNLDLTNQFLLIVAALTMFFGVLGAAAQDDFRRILSFHIVSQIGYMIMGLALYTPLAIAGAIYFIIHNIFAKMNLFLLSGIVKATNGHYLLKKLGGVYNKFPFISLLFVISAFSLAGIPPLSGFWGKFVLAKAGIAVEEYFVVGVSLFVGFLTLYSMTKIWKAVFWSPQPEDSEPALYENEQKFIGSNVLLILPPAFLALGILIISIFPDILLSYAMEAAAELLNTQEYINAVLTDRPR